MTLHASRQINRSFLSKPNMPDGIEKFGCHRMKFSAEMFRNALVNLPNQGPDTRQVGFQIGAHLRVWKAPYSPICIKLQILD